MKQRKLRALGVLMLLIVVLTALVGCAKQVTQDSAAITGTQATATPAAVTLSVFAATSMTESLNEIASRYKTAHPDVTLTFNFDSSGTLQSQIESGAEADVFLSAATKQMITLKDGGYLLDDTIQTLLSNQLVLIVPDGSTKGITSFADCATDKVKLIALGNSDVPVGQYSEEVFTSMKIWDAVKAKASLGTNVKEVLSQVSSGSVDCGVVYATDAATAKGVKVVAQAPADSHSPVVYPVGVIKASKQQQAAKDFIAYLSSKEATAVFKKVGFTIPK